jgi:cellulose synthase/poly-beta-1,6-N-acetylglucosamine synthase-like glycosyltransferase
METILNAWRAIDVLRLNHKGKLNIHVLDDGKSEEAKSYAKEFDFNYITRQSNELKKAGNLRHAFSKTSAPFIVIVDADFVLRPDFLVETLPYMYQDQKVAIVQTPQFFETKAKELNTIERGSAQIQELFYRLIQVSRNHYNGAICVGTSAVYRRSALTPHGGTAAIGHSEDVRTAVLVMNDRNKLVYLPLILSKGQCPDTWKQFFTQFYRWSTGSLSLMLTKKFWTSNLTIVQKLCFLTGFGFYVTTAISAAIAFLPSIFLLIFKPEYVFWFNVLWSIPSLLLTNIYLRFWQKTGYSWAAVECRAVSGYAHLFALSDILTKRTEAWIPTGGGARSGRYENFLGVIRAHTILLFIVLFCLISYRFGEIGLHSIPIILFFIYHCFTIKSVLIESFNHRRNK